MKKIKGGKEFRLRLLAVKALLRGELLSSVSKRTGFDTKSLRMWRQQFELGGQAQLASMTVKDFESQIPHHFVSYSRKDQRVAIPVFDELRAGGVKIWVDELAIRSGAAWRAEIDQAIRTSEKFILMLSEHAAHSREVQRELKLALDLKKEVIPVKLRPMRMTPALKKLIGSTQILSLTYYRRERTGLLIDVLGGSGVPSAPPYQEMVFRNNVYSISQAIGFLQNISWLGCQIILLANNDRDDNSYVQFAVISEDLPVMGEAVGDQNREKEHALTREQKAALVGLGWREPSRHGSGNYWRVWSCEREPERRSVASIAVRTLIEVYGHYPGEKIFIELQQNR